MSVLELPSRVAQLEQQLATALERLQELEQRPSPANLQPNVLTDINGQIGANFTGHVHAQGLDLDAGLSNTPPASDRLRWLRQSDGAAIAELYGYEAPGLLIRALGRTDETPPHGTIDLEALGNYSPASDTATTVANLELFAPQNGAATISANLSDPSGASWTPLFADSTKRSSFLQLLSAQKLRLDLGTGTLTFAGSGASDVVTIDHGLGVDPKVVLLTPSLGGVASGTAIGIYVVFGSADASSFQAVASSNSTLTIGLPFSWVAIG